MTDQTLAPAMTSPAPRPVRRQRRVSLLWLALPALLFLAVWFLWPVGQMMTVAFQDKHGAFSLEGFRKLVSSPLYQRVLQTTFAIAFQVTVICILLGYPLAYWLAKQPPRRQRIVLMLVLLAFWTSALVKNFSWLVLLGRNGVVAAAMNALGLPGGDGLLFSRPTVMLGMAHTMLPLGVVTMMPVLNQIDRRLTPAAATLGATGAQAFWRIYLPLSMRGVATAALLIFVMSLGFFITPALIGSPKETLIGQMIISQINQLQNWQFGAVLALVLMGSTLLAILLFDRVFGISSIAGGGARPRPPESLFRRLGLGVATGLGESFAKVEQLWASHLRGLPGARLLDLYAWGLILVLLFPVVGFFPMAFTAGDFMTFPPEGFSLRWFETFFSSPLWLAAMTRSFAVGLATAVVTVVLAGLAALAVVRGDSRLSGPLFLLFMAPMVVPTIVIAMSLFYVFAQFQMVATNAALIVGHSVIALPIVFVVLLGTFKGHDWRLDQAAATLGAPPLAIARRITLPLVASGLVVGFITGFLQSFEELTIAMFVGGGLVTTLPKQMWDDILFQVNPTLAAASVVVTVIVALLFLVMELMQGRARR
ncbi:ABC transporter permease [Haematobacter missouriensis]|nr:ABC transporter permease subunit [Haematobacter missouriensis]KFI32970.1 ABC transporter permease [Haematobacter missouriensis]